MPYKTGIWGEQAKRRNKKRLEYFRIHNFEKRKIGTEKIGHGIGYLGEIEALNILRKGIRNDDRRGIDVLWGNKTVEVKTSSFSQKGGGWKFFTKRQVGKCDLFLFICKNELKQTKYIFLIPSNKIDKNSFNIQLKSLSLFLKYALKVR